MPLEIDTSQNPKYLEFARRKLGISDFGNCKTIAVRRNGAVAVVVYHDKDQANIGMSIATTGPKWCSKVVLKVCFGFPFLQLGCKRITTHVKETNEVARRMNERLGFKFVAELDQYYHDGSSAIIYGMTKEECRWLK